MVIAFRAAIVILLKLIRVDKFITVSAFKPSTEPILFCCLNFDFGFTAREQSHFSTIPYFVFLALEYRSATFFQLTMRQRDFT